MQRSLFSSPQELIVVCIHEFVAGTAASHVHKHGELLRDWTFSNIDCVRLGESKALRVETLMFETAMHGNAWLLEDLEE